MQSVGGNTRETDIFLLLEECWYSPDHHFDLLLRDEGTLSPHCCCEPVKKHTKTIKKIKHKGSTRQFPAFVTENHRQCVVSFTFTAPEFQSLIEPFRLLSFFGSDGVKVCRQRNKTLTTAHLHRQQGITLGGFGSPGGSAVQDVCLLGDEM